MKTKKKIISGALALMLTASLLSGCSKSNGLSALDFSNTTLSGTITTVDGDKVTIAISGGFGGGGMGNGEGRGNRDDANIQPAGENDDTTQASGDATQAVPEKPSGEAGQLPEGADGQTPPEMPEGMNGEMPTDMPKGEMPNNNDAADGTETDNAFGDMFSQAGSTFTLSITDESLLEECTMDDIKKGSFITITFGDDNTITSITVMKLTNTQDSATPNGQDGTAPGGQEATTETGTSTNTITTDTEEANVAYSSTNDDENALRVEGIIHYTVDNLTIEKSGETSNTESSDFYGQNAGFLALNGGTSTITTTADNSGGIDVTGGGSIQASNLTIETSGNSSAAI